MQNFAKKLTNRLSNLDTKNSAIYQQNYLKLDRKLTLLKQNIQQILKHSNQSIASYSNAFGHFIKENELKQSTLITSKHEERLSIYKIIKAKKSMQANKAKCLLASTGVAPKRINTLTEGLKINTVQIDPIGSEFNSGNRQYFQLLNNVAIQVNQCLQ